MHATPKLFFFASPKKDTIEELTAKLRADPAGLVPSGLATAGIAALVAYDVHHIFCAVRSAEAGSLTAIAEAWSLSAARVLAPPVADIHLAFLLVSATELRLLALGNQ